MHTPRLYSDLAWLWPLWGDVHGEYARYGDHVAHLIETHAQRPVETMLIIGCGGGKNVFNLQKRYRVTGLDLSPAMLEQARTLNPACAFVEGDMRTFTLGRMFDAILLDDGVAHMTTRVDLLAAFRTAFRHLHPGGVLVTTADVTTETFQQNRTTIDTARDKGVEVVFIENVYDPDPNDEQYEATLIYLIREHGALRVETDRLDLGLFAQGTWQRAMEEAGLVVRTETYVDGESYTSFACVKPEQ